MSYEECYITQVYIFVEIYRVFNLENIFLNYKMLHIIYMGIRILIFNEMLVQWTMNDKCALWDVDSSK